jgi:hypothetical protein
MSMVSMMVVGVYRNDRDSDVRYRTSQGRDDDFARTKAERRAVM